MLALLSACAHAPSLALPTTLAPTSLPTAMATPSPVPTASPTPVPPLAEVTVWLPGSLDTLDPLLSHSLATPALASLLLPGLVATDAQGRYVPALADQWQSDDSRTWTFHLDESRRWQDGQPVSAADILFTVGMLHEPDSPVAPELRQAWEGVQVSSPEAHTVVLTLAGGPEQSALALATLPVLPAHRLGAVPASRLSLQPPTSYLVGSGPYRVVSASSEEVALDRAAADSAAPQRLTLQLGGGPAKTSPSVQQLTLDGPASSGSVVTRLPLAQPVLLVLNLSRPPLGQAAVRRALSAAINRSALPGAGCPVVLPSSELSHSSDTAGPVQGATTGVTAASGRCSPPTGTGAVILPWSSPLPPGFWVTGSSAPDDDLRAAGAALEQAGWLPGNDGIRRRGDTTLSLTLLVDDDAGRLAIAQAVASDWRRIGVQTTVEALGLDGMLRDYARPGHFDVLLLGLRGAGVQPPLAAVWHSGGQLNVGGWSDPVADAAIEATNAADAATRALGYERFSREFVDQLPAIPLYVPTIPFATQGVTLAPWLLAEPSDILRGAAAWRPSP